MNTTHVSDTVPYPWPYDGVLIPKRTALLICGAQAAIAAPCRHRADVLDRILSLASVVRTCGGTVIWLRHGSTSDRARRDGRAFLPRRQTGDWRLTTTPFPEDLLVDSAGWDGCFGSDLDNTLRVRSIRTIVIGGFASEVTVDSTVRTLNDQGHECLVLTDCCAPLDDSLGARAHASLTMSGGIFGALGISVAFAAALDSAGPRSTDSRSTDPRSTDPLLNTSAPDISIPDTSLKETA